MKTLNIVLAGTLLFTVTGCSSIQKFSEQDTSKLINEITTYTPVDTGKAVRAKWIQPSNKDVACKIFESSKNPELILWDGDCKSGYAYGLGREMIVVDGKSISAPSIQAIKPNQFTIFTPCTIPMNIISATL